MRSGATRHVFFPGAVVVKIPRLTSWESFLNGLLCNLQERKFSGVFPRLAPCRGDPLGLFVVMRYARPLNDTEWARINPQRWAEDLVEPKRDSFGVLDGSIVAVDYG